MASWGNVSRRRVRLTSNSKRHGLEQRRGLHPLRTPTRAADARRLEALLRAGTIFTGPFEPSSGDEATEAVVAVETGALSLLMEMKTGYLEGRGRWTGTDLFLAHGRDLALAALKLFEQKR